MTFKSNEYDRLKQNWIELERWPLKLAVRLLLADFPTYENGVVTGPWNESHQSIYDLAWDSYDLGALSFLKDDISEDIGDCLAPTVFVKWAYSHGYEIPDIWHPLLSENKKAIGLPAQRKGALDEIIQTIVDPRNLTILVDDINNQVKITEGLAKEKQFRRSELTGKGTVTWDLLVELARYNGNLEGIKSVKATKVNYSKNRENLGNKLKEKLDINESPFVKGKNGVLKFKAISLVSARKIDALDRSTNEYTDKFLASHGIGVDGNEFT